MQLVYVVWEGYRHRPRNFWRVHSVRQCRALHLGRASVNLIGGAGLRISSVPGDAGGRSGGKVPTRISRLARCMGSSADSCAAMLVPLTAHRRAAL
jgi:hypothetical protein